MNFVIKKIISYKSRLEHIVIPLFLIFVFFVKHFLENNKALFLVERGKKEITKQNKNNARIDRSLSFNRSKYENFQPNKTIEENAENIANIKASQQLNQIKDPLASENEENNEGFDGLSSKVNHNLFSDLSTPIKVINFGFYSIDTEFEKWLIKDNQTKVELVNNKEISSLSLFSSFHQKNNKLSSIKTDSEKNNKKQMNLRIGYSWLTKYSMANENIFFDYDVYLHPIQKDNR